MIQFLFNFYVTEIRLLDLQILFCAFSMKKMISQWEHHILSIEACDAIRPEYNCFISMIIYVDSLCGFAPLESAVKSSNSNPESADATSDFMTVS